MAAVEDFSPSSRVLVTGANGHVAQHVLAQLLSRPAAARPKVRATVRSESSGSGLATVFQHHIASGELEIVHVPDIVASSAFDGAISDCTHVAHIASPLVVGAKASRRMFLFLLSRAHSHCWSQPPGHHQWNQ